jgi:hypothetical protein
MPSYFQHRGLSPDFRVSYSLISAEDGGRKTPAYQHIRWDFRYADTEVSTGTFCIWPEVLTPAGVFIPEGEIIPQHGLADMLIINPTTRPFHQERIRPGVRGYFVEGPRRIAVCEVVEVLGLHQRPQA